MDTCSTKIVTPIFEMVCRDDFGQTARNLGRVSKGFRAIAEPIELHTIAVAGIKQLRGAVARLERANEAAGRTESDVHHLFISEMKAEHALAADMEWPNEYKADYARKSFWLTDEGADTIEMYRRLQYSDAFWRMAISLVRNCSPVLRTLYLLASECFFWQDAHPSSGILGALTGVSFPYLASLVVNHEWLTDAIYLRRNGQQFKTPSTPRLQKLSVTIDVHINRNCLPDILCAHPLLELVLAESSKITHLVIYNRTPFSVQVPWRKMFGDDLEVLRKRKTLPKGLRSIILKQGIDYINGSSGDWEYDEGVQRFMKEIQDIGTDGLRADLPRSVYPKVGEREFELFVAEWKEDVLAFAV